MNVSFFLQFFSFLFFSSFPRFFSSFPCFLFFVFPRSNYLCLKHKIPHSNFRFLIIREWGGRVAWCWAGVFEGKSFYSIYYTIVSFSYTVVWMFHYLSYLTLPFTSKYFSNNMNKDKSLSSTTHAHKPRTSLTLGFESVEQLEYFIVSTLPYPSGHGIVF